MQQHAIVEVLLATSQALPAAESLQNVENGAA